MNLCHHKSSIKPEQLRTGSWYNLKIQLDGLGYKMLEGHKIVINICSSYWPMIWTPRRCTDLSIRQAHLSLPMMQDLAQSCKVSADILHALPRFGPRLLVQEKEQSHYKRHFTFGLSEEKKSLKICEKNGLRLHKDSDVEFGEETETLYELHGLQDPCSAKVEIKHDLHLNFEASKLEDHAIKSRILTRSQMRCDMDNFYLDETLQVFLDGQVFFDKTWSQSVPRIFS